MGLNIKNEEAHKLAQRLAAVTGESLTAAVTEALRERLARFERQSRLDGAWAIAQDCARRLQAPGGPRMIDVDELYDEETGLPK